MIIKITYTGQIPALLAAITFNEVGLYALSPGTSGYCYTELATSSLDVSFIAISSTHCTYPWRDDLLQLA